MIFITAWEESHFKFIKESLIKEGLEEKEIDVSTKNRFFLLMIEDKYVVGFVGIKYDILPIVLEYFWIEPKFRRKKKLFCVKLIKFLKQKFKDSKIDAFIIDVKINGKFSYLYKFVKKITNTEAYRTIGNSSFFYVPLENITI